MTKEGRNPKSENPPPRSSPPGLSFGLFSSFVIRHSSCWVCLLLALFTTAVYWPVAKHGFINLDDPDYVTMNPRVEAGLTVEGIGWAFTSAYSSNWHPITWLSHMLDCQLYGLKPAGHHLTNLVFHAANVLLVLFVLRRMTGALWRSAFVAALFALHPLHVESVAWVAERKDVLSTFFGLLTIWAYARYAQSLAGEQVRKRESGMFSTRSLFHFLNFYFSAL